MENLITLKRREKNSKEIKKNREKEEERFKTKLIKMCRNYEYLNVTLKIFNSHEAIKK